MTVRRIGSMLSERSEETADDPWRTTSGCQVLDVAGALRLTIALAVLLGCVGVR